MVWYGRVDGGIRIEYESMYVYAMRGGANADAGAELALSRGFFWYGRTVQGNFYRSCVRFGDTSNTPPTLQLHAGV